MSTIPPPTTSPTAAPTPGAPVETAPSETRAEGPAFARAVGFVGLFGLVLGAVVVVATRATDTPRLVPEGWGFLFAGLGVALMLYHAIADGEQEIRRLYGGLAVLFLILAVAGGLLPGPFKGEGDKAAGYYALPWGVGFGFLALAFAVPFVRHETDPQVRRVALGTLGGLGLVLVAGTLVAGMANPNWLAGTGLAVGVLGLGFACAYLGSAETEDGLGRAVAVALGIIGACAVLYAFGRAVFPAVLHEGPAALRKPSQVIDLWKAAGRVLVVGGSAALAIWAARSALPVWLRAGLAGAGLAVGAVFVF
ncbi:MAG: hypothetical protein K2V38_24375, partial [Gemmataceae bacterium]|nr:hypothetical protein [Gemmataceae bacterium]